MERAVQKEVSTNSQERKDAKRRTKKRNLQENLPVDLERDFARSLHDDALVNEVLKVQPRGQDSHPLIEELEARLGPEGAASRLSAAGPVGVELARENWGNWLPSSAFAAPGPLPSPLFKRRAGSLARQASPLEVQSRLGAGTPLEPELQLKLEARLGAGLADVRLHTDENAGQLVKDLGARAMTVGSNVVFAPGEFRPGTAEGDRLILHELAHVLQQRAGRASLPGALPEVEGRLEQHADEVAERALKGESVEGLVGAQARLEPRVEPERAGLEREADDVAEWAMRPTAAQAPGLDPSSLSAMRFLKGAAASGFMQQFGGLGAALSGGMANPTAVQFEGGPGKTSDGKPQLTPEEQEKELAKARAAGASKAAATKATVAKAKGSPPSKDPKVSAPKAPPASDAKAAPPAKGGGAPPSRAMPSSAKSLSTFSQEATGGALRDWSNELAWRDFFQNATPEGASKAVTVDRGEIVKNALGSGLKEGLWEAGKGLLVDTAINVASTKIPYLSGFVEMAKIGKDPAGYFKGAYDGSIGKGITGVKQIGGGLKEAFGKGNWWALVDVLEGVVNIVDGVASLIGTISNILWVVAAAGFIISLFFPALFPFVALAAQWASTLGGVGTLIGLWVTAARLILVGLKALQILHMQGSPEELLAQGERLKGQTKSFTQEFAQNAGSSLRNRAGAAIANRGKPKPADNADGGSAPAATANPKAEGSKVVKALEVAGSVMSGMWGDKGSFGSGATDRREGIFGSGDNKGSLRTALDVTNAYRGRGDYATGGARGADGKRTTAQTLADMETAGGTVFASEAARKAYMERLGKKDADQANFVNRGLQQAQAEQAKRMADAEEKVAAAKAKADEAEAAVAKAEAAVSTAKAQLEAAQSGVPKAEAKVAHREKVVAEVELRVSEKQARVQLAESSLARARAEHEANPTAESASRVSRIETALGRLQGDLSFQQSHLGFVKQMHTDSVAQLAAAKTEAAKAQQNATSSEQGLANAQGAQSSAASGQKSAEANKSNTENTSPTKDYDGVQGGYSPDAWKDRKDALNDYRLLLDFGGGGANHLMGHNQASGVLGGGTDLGKEAISPLVDPLGEKLGMLEPKGPEPEPGPDGKKPDAPDMTDPAEQKKKLAEQLKKKYEEVSKGLPPVPTDAPAKIDATAKGYAAKVAQQEHILSGVKVLDSLKAQGKEEMSNLQLAQQIAKGLDKSAESQDKALSDKQEKQDELKRKSAETQQKSADAKSKGDEGASTTSGIVGGLMNLFSMIPAKVTDPSSGPGAVGGMQKGLAKSQSSASDSSKTAGEVGSEAENMKAKSGKGRSDAKAASGQAKSTESLAKSKESEAKGAMVQIDQAIANGMSEIQDLEGKKGQDKAAHDGAINQASSWINAHKAARTSGMAQLDNIASLLNADGPAPQKKAIPGAPAQNLSTPQVQARLGEGAPLEGATRARMEENLGADLSGVRVHADDTAGQVAQDMGARAVTAGSHVVFGKGEYQPGTAEGEKLLAHELTHVVQQQGGSVPAGELSPATEGRLEADADARARQAGGKGRRARGAKTTGDSAAPAVQLKGRTPGATPWLAPDQVVSGLSSGETLNRETAARMSQAVGADVSDVRVHTGPDAASMADRLGARAFTVGKDVGFAAGEYEPGTEKGDKLLAHELAHVLQQRSGKVPDDASGPQAGGLERQAQAVQQQALRGESPERAFQEAAPRSAPRGNLEHEADQVAERVSSRPAARPDARLSSALGTLQGFGGSELAGAFPQLSGLWGGLGSRAVQLDPDPNKPKQPELTPEQQEAELAKARAQGRSQASSTAASVKAAAPPTKPPVPKVAPPVGTPAPPAKSVAPKGPAYVPPPRVLQNNVTSLSNFAQETNTGNLREWSNELAWRDYFQNVTPDGAGNAIQVDRGTIVMNALKSGAASGLVEAGKGLLIDTAINVASTKIPYLSGFVEMGKIGVAFGKGEGLKYLAEMWTNPAGKIGAGGAQIGKGFRDAFTKGDPWALVDVLEGVINIVDGVAGLVATISNILWIVAAAGFIISLFFPALFPFVALAAQWASTIGGIGTLIGLWVTAARLILVGLKSLQILYMKASPAELLAQGKRLEDQTKSFTQEFAQNAGSSLRNRAAGAIKDKMSKKPDGGDSNTAPAKPSVDPGSSGGSKVKRGLEIAGSIMSGMWGDSGKFASGATDRREGIFGNGENKGSLKTALDVTGAFAGKGEFATGGSRTADGKRTTAQTLADMEQAGGTVFASEAARKAYMERLGKKDGAEQTQFVNRGQQQAQLEQAQRMAEAESKVKAAQAKVDEAQAAANRAEAEVQAAKTQLDSAKAGVPKAEANVVHQEKLVAWAERDVQMSQARAQMAESSLAKAQAEHAANPTPESANRVSQLQGVVNRFQGDVSHQQAQLQVVQQQHAAAVQQLATAKTQAEAAKQSLSGAQENQSKTQGDVSSANASQADAQANKAATESSSPTKEYDGVQGGYTPAAWKDRERALADYRVLLDWGGGGANHLMGHNQASGVLGGGVDLVLGGVDLASQVITGKKGEETPADEQNLDTRDTDQGTQLAKVQLAKKFKEMYAKAVEKLETPPTEIVGQIDSSANSYASKVGEQQYILEGMKSIDALKVEGRKEIEQLALGKKIAADLEKGNKTQQQALFEKEKAQAELAAKAAANKDKSKAAGDKSKEGASTMGGIMGGLMKLFSMVPSKITDAGSGPGGATKMNEGLKKQNSASDDSAKAANLVGDSSSAMTSATAKGKSASSGAASAAASAVGLASSKEAQAKAAMVDLDTALANGAAQVQTLEKEKAAQKQAHDAAVNKGAGWISSHKAARTAGMAELTQMGVQLEQSGPAPQKKAIPGAPAQNLSTPQIQARLGEGAPLEGATRGRMEENLGTDLSGVRVHADDAAGQVAQDMGARAVTAGSHVVFGKGEYQPGTDEGDRLLAHELTHVVQQRGGSAASSERSPASEGRLEAEADAASERGGQKSRLTGVGGPARKKSGMGAVLQLKARYASDVPALGPEMVASELKGGESLQPEVATRMSQAVQADVRDVRVHTGPEAASVANRLGARAFTMGKDVGFAAGEYAPGTDSGDRLLAHELTHVVQQSGGRAGSGLVMDGGLEREADLAGERAAKGGQTVSFEKPMAATSLTDAVEPGFESGPGIGVYTAGQAKRAASGQPAFGNLSSMPQTPGMVRPLESAARADAVQLWGLGDLWEGAKNLAKGAVAGVASLAGGVKDAIMSKLSGMLKNVPGYDVFTLVIGQDPIAGKPVERTGPNVIKAVMGLIPGGAKKFADLEKSGAIDKAWTWLQGELTKLNLSWDTIKGLISQTFSTIGAGDLLNPVGLYEKLKGIFAAPIGRIMNFAGAVGKKILEVTFEGVLNLAGGYGKKVMDIVRRAGGALSQIFKDPVGFAGNLVKAVQGGFQNFMAKAPEHLQNGITGWLFGALGGAGLKLPAKLDLQGMLHLALQVTGLTYDALRMRMVKSMGEDRVKKVETGLDYVQKVQKDGLAGIKDDLVQYISNLPDLFLGAIKNWAVTKIVQQAILKLVSMFNPAGAVIQAIMAVYNTIVFFIERAEQISSLMNAVFESMANIASGNLGAAINYIEQSMAKAIPVIISFLARLIGLGGITEQIKKIIAKIQAPIEKALDKVVDFIQKKVKDVWDKLFGKKDEKGKEGPGSDKAPVDAPPGSAPTVVEHPFVMAGARHTMIVTYGKAGQIEMASRRDTLSKKVGRAVGALMKRQPQTDELKAQIDELKAIGGLAKGFQKSVQGDNPDKTVAAKLAEAISAYSAKYKVRDVDEEEGGVTPADAASAKTPRDKLLEAQKAGKLSAADLEAALKGVDNAGLKTVLTDKVLMGWIVSTVKPQPFVDALAALKIPFVPLLNVALYYCPPVGPFFQGLAGKGSDADRTKALTDAKTMALAKAKLSAADYAQFEAALKPAGAAAPEAGTTAAGPNTLPANLRAAITEAKAKGAVDLATLKTWIGHYAAAQWALVAADQLLMGWLIQQLMPGTTLLEMAAKVPLGTRVRVVVHHVEAASRLMFLQGIVRGAGEAELKSVWTNESLMSEVKAGLSESDYLTFVTNVKMFHEGTTKDGGKHTEAEVADQNIQEILSQYVGNAVKAGKKIAGQVAVVDDAHWHLAGNTRYGEAWAGRQARINGFVDSKGRVFIHKDRGDAGTMVHEAIHKYSARNMIALSQPLNEGMTEYFARKVCSAMTPPITNRTSYQDNYDSTNQLVHFVTEQVVASAYFDGNVPGLKAAFVAKKMANGETVEAAEKAWTDFVAHTKADNWMAAFVDCM